MMERQTLKVTRLLTFIALSFVLVVSSLFLPGNTAQAASKKTTISTTSMTIPVGKLNDKIFWNKSSWEINNGEKLSVLNPVKGATYQFTSSNSKVATVNKSGGFLTGVKAGSTTITCTQTYKSKKTTIGKCKVTVKNAGLYVSEYSDVYAVGNNGFDLTHYYNGLDPIFNITYRNPKATYTLTSNSNKFSIKEVKYDASKAKSITDNKDYAEVLSDYIGNGYFYGYQFSAKEAGTYTVTVKETYNKTTKTLGTIKVVVKAATIAEPKVDIRVGKYLSAFTLINYSIAGTEYYFEIKDFDDASPENYPLWLMQNDELYLYGNKAGSTEVTIREGGKDGNVIGTVTVTVSEAACEEIILEEPSTAYVDDYFSLYYDLEPWDTTDTVSIESDNPEVLKVEYDQESEEWVYSPLKAGEVTITIKCGNQSVTTKVIVEEQE